MSLPHLIWLRKTSLIFFSGLAFFRISEVIEDLVNKFMNIFQIFWFMLEWPSRPAHEPVGMQIANPPTNFINIQITGASYLARHAERFAENNQVLLTGSSWSQSTCKSTLFLRTDFAKKQNRVESAKDFFSITANPATNFINIQITGAI